MLKCTLEVVPYGIETAKRTLYEIEIINDGTGTNEIGNYRCIITDEKGNKKKVKINKFNRDEGALGLLETVIHKHRNKNAKKDSM